MLPHVAGQIQSLASTCNTTRLPTSNGWTADVWVLSDDSLGTLVDTYRTLLRPELTPDIENTLAAQGVNLDLLLLDQEHERDAITRADMTELAAAAAAAAMEQWPLETILMPNVPKGSRGSSETGQRFLESFEPVRHLRRGGSPGAGHLVRGPAQHARVREVVAVIQAIGHGLRRQS